MGKFQFAGDVQGRGDKPVARYGTKDSGMVGEVGGWRGMIRTRVWYDRDKDRDMFMVELIPHWYDSGQSLVLAEGVLDHKIDDPYIVPALIA